MVDVSVDHGCLIVAVEGADQLWSFKSSLTIPLSSVSDVRIDPGAASGPHGWRGPGTSLPRVITAGTFHERDGEVFWDVHDPAGAIVIELEHERYRRLIVEVADPSATVALIRAASAEGAGE